MYWTKKVPLINPLFIPVGTSDPVISEIDTLIKKAMAAAKLKPESEFDDKDAERLSVLTAPFQWGEEELNTRAELLTKSNA